ncbi:MAG TPA: thiamine pyrophosphate-dependent enzyme, partial [Anaerolineae bacterium]|nr:thiamine pyrophosphate-dependent enzyme [Anaerolineae bacterium]
SVIKEAFHIARTGRPGPVLIDVSRDVQAAELEYEYPDEVHLPGYRLPRNNLAEPVARAAAMIDAAERPVIIAGHGVVLAGAEEALQALAEKARVPVVTTLLGIGALPETHPLCQRMAGMHGEMYTNLALAGADVIVALGCRFDDRLTGPVDQFAQGAKIVHVDLDPAEIDKNVLVDLAVIGDLREVLPLLHERVEVRDRQAWLGQIAAWRDDSAGRDIVGQEGDELVPQYVVRQIWHATRGEVVVVSDVGQNQMWEAQYFTHHRRRALLSSGGLGTMGFALPAAIGAQMGLPDQQIWVTAGDGGFQMNIQELATVVQERLPLKIAILNNGYLGMVRQWQQLFFEGRYSGTPLLGPDFARVAEAYGIPGLTVREKGEVEAAIERAMHTDGPVLIDFRVVQEENVYPMVIPGKPMSDMIRRPAPAVRS